MSEINDVIVDDAKDIGVVMSMYNLIEYSDIYSKTLGLLQYYRDEPALDNNSNIVNFSANNDNILFKFKEKNRKPWYKKCGNNGTIKISK